MSPLDTRRLESSQSFRPVDEALPREGVRQVEAACRTATEALDLALAVDSPRVTAHLLEFRHQLAPFRALGPVIDLEARLTEATG